MPNSTEQDADLEADLSTLPRMPVQQLRERWRALFRNEPPPAFGPDLLRRSIAQRIQEQRHGGLSASAQRQLNQIVRVMASKPDCRIEPPRRIKTGAVLVRAWKEKSHRATVLDDGFSFEGRVYLSLSEIAREITGTRWNGPRFFGLRATRPPENSHPPAGTKASRARGRPRAPFSDLFTSGMEVGDDL